MAALLAQGLSDSAVAQQVGATRDQVLYFRHKTGIKANTGNSGGRSKNPPEVLAEIERLVLEERLSDIEVAKRLEYLGVKRDHVVYFRRRNGIPANYAPIGKKGGGQRVA